MFSCYGKLPYCLVGPALVTCLFAAAFLAQGCEAGPSDAVVGSQFELPASALPPGNLVPLSDAALPCAATSDAAAVEPAPAPVEPQEEGCAEGAACSEAGRCTSAASGCRAATDADCQASTGCLRADRCRAGGGRCVTSADMACRQTDACVFAGRCAWSEDLAICVVDADADCKVSGWCQLLGRCTFVDDECAVATDKDCVDSETCAWAGACHADGGKCVK